MNLGSNHGQIGRPADSPLPAGLGKAGARPVAIPLPSRDFDPTEVAICWMVLKQLGHDVVFATSDGREAQADDIVLTGEGMDLWGFIPGLRRLVAFGRFVRANADARRAYAQMRLDPAFKAPLSWSQLSVQEIEGLLLPGGHRALGMRQYLESEILQKFVSLCFDAGLPVAAICHGVVLAARSRTADGARSVLYGRRTTALTWALERKGWIFGRIFRFWDPSITAHIPTARETPPASCPCRAKSRAPWPAPKISSMFPPTLPTASSRRAGGLTRDRWDDDRAAFVVRDGDYVSARWPGDAHAFARQFAGVLSEPRTRAGAVASAPNK